MSHLYITRTLNYFVLVMGCPFIESISILHTRSYSFFWSGLKKKVWFCKIQFRVCANYVSFLCLQTDNKHTSCSRTNPCALLLGLIQSNLTSAAINHCLPCLCSKHKRPFLSCALIVGASYGLH